MTFVVRAVGENRCVLWRRRRKLFSFVTLAQTKYADFASALGVGKAASLA